MNRCGAFLRAKEKLGLAKNRFVDVDALNAKFGKPEFEAAAQDIADRGVTLLRNDAHALPLDATKPLRLLVVALSGDPDAFPGADFEDEIRKHVDTRHRAARRHAIRERISR